MLLPGELQEPGQPLAGPVGCSLNPLLIAQEPGEVSSHLCFAVHTSGLPYLVRLAPIHGSGYKTGPPGFRLRGLVPAPAGTYYFLCAPGPASTWTVVWGGSLSPQRSYTLDPSSPRL